MRTWPLPALLTWAAAWVLALALRAAQAPLWAALALPTALGVCATWLPFVANTTWRRVFVAAGFPLSVIVMGQGAGLPGWLWLAPLALLLLAYPVHAWRDAPVFPTPHGALRDLPAQAPLVQGEDGRQAHILDAGCGMGDALAELHAAYPQAQIHGIEWSWIWRLVAALRCPWAKVKQGDMWAQSWADVDLVYLFQRPETMPRAWEKARREMRDGAWLVSLEFAVTDGRTQVKPHACLHLGGGRPIWVYRIVSHTVGRPTTL